MLQSHQSTFLTSIMPLWFGACVPSTEDTHRSTVHIWSVLALFLICLQYNHLIELTAKIKTHGSLVGKLSGSTQGSNTLLRYLPSFLLLREGLKLGAFPPCSVVWHTATHVRGLIPPLLVQVMFCQLFAIQLAYLIFQYMSASLTFLQFTLNPGINFAMAYFLTAILGCSLILQVKVS